MHGRISKALTVITIFALLATGCTSQAYNIGMAKDKEHKVIDTGFSVMAHWEVMTRRIQRLL